MGMVVDGPPGPHGQPGGRESPIKKPTTAMPAPSTDIQESGAATVGPAGGTVSPHQENNIGVIQAVTIVSPQNVKRTIPNKPKTVDSVNLGGAPNVKKTPVVVKGKPAVVAQQPLTLPEEMINRDTALTPSVYGDAEKSQMQQTSTVLSED